MGLDLRYIFAPTATPTLALDFENLPLKRMADYLGLQIVKDSLNYFDYQSKTIGLNEINYFIWFHELAHAIEAHINGSSILISSPVYRVEEYVATDVEIVA